jgi:hypothetical protein
MSELGRRVRAAVNPVSTAATRWWCHSSLRFLLAGQRPTAARRRLTRHRVGPGAIVRVVPNRGGLPHGGPAPGGPPSAGVMNARAAATDALFSREQEGR